MQRIFAYFCEGVEIGPIKGKESDSKHRYPITGESRRPRLSKSAFRWPAGTPPLPFAFPPLSLIIPPLTVPARTRMLQVL